MCANDPNSHFLVALTAVRLTHFGTISPSQVEIRSVWNVFFSSDVEINTIAIRGWALCSLIDLKYINRGGSKSHKYASDC